MKLLQSLCAASFLTLAGLTALTTFTAGCGGDEGTTSTGKAISELEITSGIDTLAKGSTVKFQAMATYADGTTEDVSDDGDAVWNTDDPEVATVAKDGTVTAVSAGDVDITVTYMGKTAEESFFVTP
jgi:uncharacterized protein YjdB